MVIFFFGIVLSFCKASNGRNSVLLAALNTTIVHVKSIYIKACSKMMPFHALGVGNFVCIKTFSYATNASLGPVLRVLPSISRVTSRGLSLCNTCRYFVIEKCIELKWVEG